MPCDDAEFDHYNDDLRKFYDHWQRIRQDEKEERYGLWCIVVMVAAILISFLR